MYASNFWKLWAESPYLGLEQTLSYDACWTKPRNSSESCMFTCAIVGYSHQVGVKRNETATSRKRTNCWGSDLFAKDWEIINFYVTLTYFMGDVVRSLQMKKKKKKIKIQ